MLEIAGGIVLAIIILALLPLLLVVAVRVLQVLAICLVALAAIIAAVWLYEHVGDGTASLERLSAGDILFYVGLTAFVALSLWLQSFEDDREIIPEIRRLAKSLWPWRKE